MKAPHVVLLATLTTCFLTTNALKCHVCLPDVNDLDSCKSSDLGQEKDGCRQCVAKEMMNDQVQRLCSNEVDDRAPGCEFEDRSDGKKLQVCLCNTDRCNVLKPLISCHVCDFIKGECTTQNLGPLTDGCLSCNSLKVNENSWIRQCMPGDDVALGCRLIQGLHTCFCVTDGCNAEDIILPTMKCYVCEPTSVSDTRCNGVNSGTVQDGCLTCVRSLNERKIVTRSCSEFAKGPSRREKNGKTIVQCSTDLCNGEEEDTFGKDTSRGSQKTVSNRVMIGGAVAAMLGLALLF